ncbi:cupin domain-containing protein [Hymenobacter sp. BT491]|uniref:cupin domain-containing protein n=1 Tax=Hymenobacter sp. BT491 TaxID=2766779 RepID=UPI0016538583|nr:cupin domain-containing protein [Hymenobacter sp. BT491]MBC6992051.1 cupin domain-containing protein [Hymenobacter sp. BT491]
MKTLVPNLFVEDRELTWETVGEGVRRKILTYDANMMLVRVAFEQGGVGAIHRHVHTQMSYVESGVFEVTIADEKKVNKRTLRAGDSFYAPSNVWHGVVCLEAGELLDTFTPMREDFV